jgi:hypothetical protein
VYTTSNATLETPSVRICDLKKAQSVAPISHSVEQVDMLGIAGDVLVSRLPSVL